VHWYPLLNAGNATNRFIHFKKFKICEMILVKLMTYHEANLIFIHHLGLYKSRLATMFLLYGTMKIYLLILFLFSFFLLLFGFLLFFFAFHLMLRSLDLWINFKNEIEPSAYKIIYYWKIFFSSKLIYGLNALEHKVYRIDFSE
jgi:hypothetical protein